VAADALLHPRALGNRDDDENASIHCGRAEAVMRDGGIRLLLGLAKSCWEGLQSEAAKVFSVSICIIYNFYLYMLLQSFILIR
jgi:hypothetical protein